MAIGENFDRKNHPSLRKAIRGLKIERPVKQKPKRPISRELMYIFKKNLCKQRMYKDQLYRAVYSTAFATLLRPSELVTGESEHELRNEMLVLGRGLWNKVNEIRIIFSNSTKSTRKSKTNAKGSFELTCAECSCDKFPLMWCAAHEMEKYLRFRNRRFGKRKMTEAVFLDESGRPLKYDIYRRSLHKAFAVINKKENLNLNSSLYTPHAFRSGGCTELARRGYKESFIKKVGRWKSDCWADFYFSLDFTDISLISGKPISKLWRELEMQRD